MTDGMQRSQAAQAAAERAAKLFDVLADTYDNVGVEFFGPIADELVAALDPRAGDDWLDLGCGRGAVLLRAARAVGPSGRAVGLDISPGMVAQTRRLITEAGLAHVEAAVADVQAPGLVPSSWDVVSSSLVLFFLPDPAAALAAWRELLRPGGRLGVTTFGPQDPRWARIDALLTPYQPPQQRDARTTGTTGPFASDAAMEQLVAEAGFTDVRTVTVEIPVRFASADQWHAFSRSVGQRLTWESMDAATRDRVLAEAAGILAEGADDHGDTVLVQQVRQTLAVRPA